MITLFSTCRPFTKEPFTTSQTNAIVSWSLLEPKPEIILFGDEEGVEDLSQHLGCIHIPKIDRNAWGTPLVGALFENAERLASNKLRCYINADIILMQDFIDAVERIEKSFDQFLMIGSRLNLEVNKLLHFDVGWQEELQEWGNKGWLEPPTGCDYFVFTEGLYSDAQFPEMAVGRYSWDCWLVWKMLSRSIPVIDATKAVMAIHQAHQERVHWVPGNKEVSLNVNNASERGGVGRVAHATWKLTKQTLERKGD
jgi:hypothetical protein